jgi:hypothetical protein
MPHTAAWKRIILDAASRRLAMAKFNLQDAVTKQNSSIFHGPV